MADVITRFKLETNQFDSKLRDAAKSLSDLTHQLSMGGKDFERFAKEHVNTAKSFGEVASGATNLKDKLKDLVSAYNQVAKSYNVLSKDQQQTDFGKAMAESLQTLQQRIKDTKSELNSAPSFVDKLTERFTVSFDAVKMFNVGLKAAEGAMKVAKDAFFQSESNIDEWGRTVEGAKGAYTIFLDTLNSGNWSSFFQNLQTAIQGGRDLYDAFDRLASIKANNQLAIATVQAQIQQLRVLKQQGQDVDQQIKDATKRLRDLQMEGVNAGARAGARQVTQTILNRANAIGGSGIVGRQDLIEAARQLRGRGNSYVEEQKSVVSRLEKEGAKEVVKYNNATKKYYTDQVFNLENLTKEQKRQYVIAKAITEGETEIQKGLSAWTSAVTEGASVTREEFKGNRYALQGSGGSGSSGGKGSKTTTEITYATDSIAAMEAEVSRLTKLWKEAGDAVRDDYALQLSYAKQQLSEMMRGFNPGNVRPIADMTGRVPTPDFGSDWKKDKNGKWYDATAPVAPDKIQFSDSLQKFLDNFEKQQMKSGNETVKALEKFNGDVSKITGGVGSIVSGLQQMGVEIPSEIQNVLGVLTGMSTIMSGITSILSLILIAENIQTTESTIKSIPMIGWALARGGVVKAAMGYEVPGNHYSGDMVPALLNSGETVLNRAQSGILAAQLEGTGNGFKNGQIVGVIEGERLKLVLNNHFRRIGQGELVTW